MKRILKFSCSIILIIFSTIILYFILNFTNNLYSKDVDYFLLYLFLFIIIYFYLIYSIIKKHSISKIIFGFSFLSISIINYLYYYFSREEVFNLFIFQIPFIIFLLLFIRKDKLTKNNKISYIDILLFFFVFISLFASVRFNNFPKEMFFWISSFLGPYIIYIYIKYNFKSYIYIEQMTLFSTTLLLSYMFIMTTYIFLTSGIKQAINKRGGSGVLGSNSNVANFILIIGFLESLFIKYRNNKKISFFLWVIFFII